MTDILIESGQLKDNWVGFALARDPAADSESPRRYAENLELTVPGHVVFGDALKSRFAKPDTAVTLPNPNVTGAKYYSAIEGMTVNGKTIKLPFPGPVALLDTGTEDLYMPPDVRLPCIVNGGVADQDAGHGRLLQRVPEGPAKCDKHLDDSTLQVDEPLAGGDDTSVRGKRVRYSVPGPGVSTGSATGRSCTDSTTAISLHQILQPSAM